MVDLKLIAKGGLIVLIIVAVAVLIEQLTWSGRTWDEELDDLDNEVLPTSDTLWSPINDFDEYNKNDDYNKKFAKCLREHSSNSYYPIIPGKNVLFSSVPRGRRIHDYLISITRILESLNLRLILVEPTLLFCMLPLSQKFNLLIRGFSPAKFKGSKNVVTFGLDSSQAKILDEAKTSQRLASFHYKILRFAGKSESLLTNGSSDAVSHYFIRDYDLVAHIIVLQPRETFLFSSALVSPEVNFKGLQYVDDRAFENFTTSTIYLDTSSIAPVLLPSDSRRFLLDMMSSKFLECKDPITDISSSRNSKVLRELKSILASRMVIFWLWSKSLQGWYEQCDIQYYSDELRFSVAAKSVEGFNFSALFAKSSCQHVESYSEATNNISSVQINCFDVKLHLIFMYEDQITYWTEYVDAKNIYRLRFPKFTLCSTAIYGQKVNVPCETGELLESEYGHFLKNTTLTLEPENMKNVILLMERKR